jgi:hypothetical protein
MKAPTLIRVSAADRAVAFQTLLFVVQTQAAPGGAPGSVVWNLCVWQVTVIRPAQKQMEAGIIAKSI